MKNIPDVPHSRENAVRFFISYVDRNRDSLKNKKVFDLSAGSGFIANEFLKSGADVHPFDLFPEQNQYCSKPCQKIDLQQPFPINDYAADIVICAETLEHLPNQFFFFREVSRILKSGGILIISTPNTSSLRSRFSQFLMESEHYSRPAPNELDAFTKWKDDQQEGYFSKLFLSGVLRLRTLAALSQLRIEEIHKTKYSSTSILLLLFYPMIYYFSRKNRRRQLREDLANQNTFKEIFEINTSLKVLLSQHMIIEFRKG